MFWGVGARSKRKGERNGLLGLLWCSCARQRGFWGSARGYPRRRRGGGRLGSSGRCGARGRAGEHQREQRRAVEEEQHDAWAPARSERGRAGSPRQAGGAENRGSRLEEGDKDLNAISKLSGTKPKAEITFKIGLK